MDSPPWTLVWIIGRCTSIVSPSPLGFPRPRLPYCQPVLCKILTGSTLQVGSLCLRGPRSLDISGAEYTCEDSRLKAGSFSSMLYGIFLGIKIPEMYLCQLKLPLLFRRAHFRWPFGLFSIEVNPALISQSSLIESTLCVLRRKIHPWVTCPFCSWWWPK